MYGKFQEHLKAELQSIKDAGLYKDERIIVTPQDAEIKLATGKENTIWLVCAGTGQMWRGYLNRLKTDNN